MYDDCGFIDGRYAGSSGEGGFGCFVNVMEIILLILLMIFVSTATGCSIARKSVKTETVSENSADSTRLKVSSVSADDILIVDYWKKVLDGHTDAKITVYDTSKPVEKETSRPPVLMDIEMATSISMTSSGADTAAAVSRSRYDAEAIREMVESNRRYSYGEQDFESETKDGILMWSLLIGGFAIATSIQLGWWKPIIRLFRKE